LSWPDSSLAFLSFFLFILFASSIPQRGQAATKQEKGLGDIKMLWQDDGGKMI
jgi:hypothetical protein